MLMDETKQAVRLNLGAGDHTIPGYISVDHKTGGEAYPLAYGDCAVDDIYASHVLEHFSHTKTVEVLRDWLRALKPGGRLRVAVPDFSWIADHYTKGEPINSQGYVMGGHIDADDHHGCIFDREMLIDLLLAVGFERIGTFTPEYDDCTQLPVSLNLQAYKPASSLTSVEKVVAMLSAPRFGPVMHFRAVGIALARLGIPYHIGQGAYWHQVLSEQLEELLTTGATYILTVDYDSVFSQQEVLELYRLMRAFPEIDALCGMQMRRGNGQHTLFCGRNDDGSLRNKMYVADFRSHITRVATGHFGLTLLKASALQELPRPWMLASPNLDGRWGEGKTDADLSFWHHWGAAGKSLYLANNVLVGHLCEMVRWPTPGMNASVWQEPADYVENGIPAEARRTCSQ